MAKKVVLMEFEGNPNIGLYMFVNDKFCILGKEVSKEKKKEIEKVLDVPIYVTSVLSTDLIGVFVSGNNEFLVVPDMYDYEMKVFEKICSEHSTKLIVMDDKLNTLGNNLCFGETEIVINAVYSKKFKSDLSKGTGLKVIDFKNPEFENAGGVIVFKNGKYFLSQEINENEVSEIASKVSGVGSINSGSAFVASGVVGNSNGVLIGSASSTVEIQSIVEGLDYL